MSKRRRPTKSAIPPKPEPASTPTRMIVKHFSSRPPVTKMPEPWEPPPPRWLAPLIEKLDKRKHPGKWRPRRKQAHVAKRAKRASARLNLEFEELPLADQVIITLLRVSYPADDFFDVPIKILMRKIEPDWRAACEKPGLKFRELNRHAVRRALKSARKLLR
jgi:hypothetical protein